MADATEDKKVNIHKGHRDKIKKRYYESGLKGMPDHNVLEFLLFFGIPQKDTNPIAHELINKFGSFSGVLEAKMSDLLSVKGMTENAACLLTMLLPTYKRYVNSLHKRKRKFETTEEIVEFLRPLYLDTQNERVYVLCFDSQERLIACRAMSDGTEASAYFDCKMMASIILEVKAKKVIISHNHPNGSLRPSNDDVAVTETMREFLSYLNVQLLDHIIITDKSYFSMAHSSAYIHIIHGVEPLDLDAYK